MENWHTYFVGLWALLVHNAEKCVSKIISNIYGALDKSIKHIFSNKHITNGLMDLGKNRKDIFKSITSKIKDANKSNLLKEGGNQIKTTINGVEAEIRVFIKDGKALSIDCFKGHSKRNMGNTILLK